MKPLLAAAVLATGLVASIVGPLRAEITAEQVRKAIDRGVGYLKGQQRPDGSWADMLGMPGGISALCTLALLNSGVEPDDPAIQKALEHLRKLKPERTYVVSLQTMVFARAEPEKDRLLIDRNVKWLERPQIAEGDCKGAWTYPGMRRRRQLQLAVRAAGAARGRAGRRPGQRPHLAAGQELLGELPERRRLLGLHRAPQPGTGSMTCAGITSLVIAADRVQAERRPGRRRPHRLLPAPAIRRGPTASSGACSGWDSTTRSATIPAAGATWALYYLYGLERAGRLTARRFIPLPARAGPARPRRLVPRRGRLVDPPAGRPVGLLGRAWASARTSR